MIEELKSTLKKTTAKPIILGVVACALLIGLVVLINRRPNVRGEYLNTTVSFPSLDESDADGNRSDGLNEKNRKLATNPKGRAKAVFGSGCFWCSEAVFQSLKGVDSVKSGYSGGKVRHPTYRSVTTGTTGHAEVVKITFDPKVISYAELLEVFWRTHDPTTLNRQGNDVGTHYRSVIFYDDEAQRTLAEHYKKKIDASGVFKDPIVTEISPLTEFYAAEGYHQNYYNQNTRAPYCRLVIQPKLEKLKSVFSDKLKQTP